MGFEDELTRLKTKAATEAAKLQARAAAEAAKRMVSAFADEALDDLERALLGKEGAADEILARDQDPLDRLRAQYGTDEPTADAPGDRLERIRQEAADREARARVELEALKKKLGKT